MKDIIIRILTHGASTTKKPAAELVKYLYPLQYIVREGYWYGSRGVGRNDNPFWRPENHQNRNDLINDVQTMCGHSMTRGSYYRIIDRFENGDSYGIVQNGPWAI